MMLVQNCKILVQSKTDVQNSKIRQNSISYGLKDIKNDRSITLLIHWASINILSSKIEMKHFWYFAFLAHSKVSFVHYCTKYDDNNSISCLFYHALHFITCFRERTAVIALLQRHDKCWYSDISVVCIIAQFTINVPINPRYTVF